MKEIFKIVFVIIGTLIGAGFASGQEIYTFFFVYGKSGIIGIFLMSFLISLVLYKVFIIISNKKIDTYKEFIEFIIKKSDKQSKDFNVQNILNKVINIFILITFYIMIAAFGAYFKQEFNINSLIGSSILGIIAYFTLIKEVKGLVKVNEILVPILIILVVLIGTITINQINIIDAIEKLEIKVLKTNIVNNIYFSSILYVSYNSILMIPVLVTLRKYIKSKTQIKLISIITGGIICILSVILYLILLRLDVSSLENSIEMPVVYIVSKISNIFKYIYGLIILGAIYTTTISLGISFLENENRNEKIKKKIALVMCFTGICFSLIGFANLVNLLYPIFGYIGFFQISKLIVSKSELLPKKI